MKASAAENTADAIVCGSNYDWVYGNIVIDRDRFNYGRKYGLSIAGGVLAFGVAGDGDAQTICGTTGVLDGRWHHIAVQRRYADGWMWLFVDGRLESQADGPDGDISYPDDAAPSVREDVYCQGPDGAWGGTCENDPYLIIGAEKHDAGADDGTGSYPPYSGWVDEVRLSDVLRYPSGFTPPSAPFALDGNTVALYHFDDGPPGPCAGIVADSSGASGGPSHGSCSFGGSDPSGPVYVTDTPFSGDAGTPTPVVEPVILGAPDAAPLASSAVIKWQTNVMADSRVRYGPVCDQWEQTATEPTQVLVHALVLVGLTPSTSYCYQAQSANAAAPTSWTSSREFVTLASEWRQYFPTIVRVSSSARRPSID
jgi:hypothetical protein